VRLQEEIKKVTLAVTKMKEEEFKAQGVKMQEMKAQIDQIMLNHICPYFLDSTILTTFYTRKMVAEFLLQYSSKIQLSKIYKTSDGWTADQIHAKIDG
jgi:hypothetical protein